MSAEDLATTQSESEVMQPFAGLTSSEVRARLQDAADNREADAEKKEIADLCNMADGLIYTTMKSVEDLFPALGVDSATMGYFIDSCDDLRDAIVARDKDRLKMLLEEFVEASHRLLERFGDPDDGSHV